MLLSNAMVGISVCDFRGVSDNQYRRPDRFKRQIKNGLRHEGFLRPRLAPPSWRR
jgi:hypothetical protein